MFEERIFNFSAGPSMLPVKALEEAKEDLMNYKGSGMSVMEMSHRSKVYDEIITETQALMRKVLAIPENYEVLFLQGGASLQFACVPMNLLKTGKADYVLSGQFSTKAYKEAQIYSEKIHCAASSKDATFSYIPQQEDLDLTPDADYLHICYNNTIFGTKFPYIPETGGVPLVADMSSSILSEPIDVSKFGVIYAGAQKNVAPAGLTIVIVRKDLLGDTLPNTPSYCSWKNQAENDSMLNTPPCWSIYMCKLVLEWIESLGGLETMKAHNEKKAGILYSFLDKSDLFKNAIAPRDRSLMNATFVTGDADLDAKFVKEAAAAGFVNLKGHRSVGGMRASIYNAMPIEGVEKLVAFMEKFEAENK